MLYVKNVALIIYSLKGGGAERVVSTLSFELAKKYNLYIVVFDSDNIAYDFAGQLVDLNLKASPTSLGRLINGLKRTLKLRKFKRKYEIDCSISFMESANLPNVLSRVAGEKVVISFHSSSISRRFTTINSSADRIIGVSEGVSDTLREKCKLPVSKIRTIYNPVDISHVKTLSNGDSVISNDERFIIATMGRLSQPKGQWHLIRAFSKVRTHIPNAMLLILGEGALRTYLEKLVLDLDLQMSVILAGHQKNPFKELTMASLFVLPSLYEGFPMVLCEAMALGLPIISTDCKYGPREILAPGTKTCSSLKKIEYARYGVLVPVCDGVQYDAYHPLTGEEELLADSIVALYKKEELRKKYAKISKLRALDFDISNIAQEWETLINEE
jgi:glycosyltransferase involved in cell wall biosynthesis